jgi:hypothetical protein
MMWDVVVAAWHALLLADTDLMAALNGVAVTPEEAAEMDPADLQEALALSHIYPAQAARPVVVPSVEWSLIGDREVSLFNPLTLQVDYWCRGMGRASTIEWRIRTLSHRDTSRVMGGIRLWTRYLDSRNHDYPADPGVLHRSLDLQLEPLRARYATITGG